MGNLENIIRYNKDPRFHHPAKECWNKVYMFVSVDIVGSTQFKTTIKSWTIPYLKVLDSIFDSFQCLKNGDNIKSLEFWKFSGDELLFYHEIEAVSDISILLELILGKLNYFLKEGTKESNLLKESGLSLQATCWISYFDDFPEDDEEKEGNYAFLIKGGRDRGCGNDNELYEKIKEYDFIGPSMDEGFRVTSLSRKGVLAISFDIAFLLRYYKGINSDFFTTVGYNKLKGIWEGIPYPVCWYFKTLKNWKKFIKHQDSYFLPYECEILKGIDNAKWDSGGASYSTDIHKTIPATIDHLTNLINIIKKFKNDVELISEINKSKENPTSFESYIKKELLNKRFEGA